MISNDKNDPAAVAAWSEWIEHNLPDPRHITLAELLEAFKAGWKAALENETESL